MDLFIKCYNEKFASEYRKVARYLKLLDENRYYNNKVVENIEIYPCDYKTSNVFPNLGDFVSFKSGDFWGGKPDCHAWFHLELDIVETNTYLRVYTEQKGVSTTNPQFLVYINGKVTQGLDTNHREVLLNIGHNDIYIYGYIALHLSSTRLFVETVQLDEDVNALYYDIRYAFKTLDFYRKDSQEYEKTIEALYRIVNMLYVYDFESDEFINSVKLARTKIRDDFYKKAENLYGGKTICIGHTHIDCAWLWTLKQTKEKVQRSFSTVIELMKRYPKYKFMASQPLQYKFLKEENPELFENVKIKIREGRWECEGSMWVESDCNLISGESLIRQILFGKSFFKKEFNKENHILWLPDVFGYPASLPQILCKSGIDWFVTSKISWNDTNKMPYDTFHWIGIDGSLINTYFLTGQDCDVNDSVTYTSYVGETDSTWINGTYKRYQQTHLNNEVLLPFGWGDGGGGPTEEQLELLDRAESGLFSCPKAEFEFVGDYFNRLSKRMSEATFPKWNGELYFEYHRGVYTTIGRNKWCNRKSEFLFQNAEMISVLSKILKNTKYPKEKLNIGWEKILVNQFHDIIPGSSIRQVYDDSEKDYKEIFSIGESVLLSGIESVSDCLEKDTGLIVFNPHGFDVSTYAQFDEKTIYVENIPSKGYTLIKSYNDTNTVKLVDKIVKTSYFDVKFDNNWQIISIYDKVNDREVVPNGTIANEFRLYADYPDDFDAWNWEKYSNEEWKTLDTISSIETIQDGARFGIKIERKFYKSSIIQKIWFYDNLNRIDFDTIVNWHEQHKMLKVAFPVDINANKATFDIQFGSIERPTHYNTSWEQAKYEVCAHKYVDISDNGFGISLLNDCKYGHDVHEGVIQLSLLRSTTEPNEVADIGEHKFIYSLCTHAGTLFESNTIEQAYILNNPLIIAKPKGKENSLPTNYSLLKIDKKNIICETVKLAENDNSIIMRLYECNNKKSKANICFGFDVVRVELVNMLEEKVKSLDIKNNNLELIFNGFEIITLKIYI